MNDHEFLVRIDLKSEGYSAPAEDEMTERQKEEHHGKIRKFLTDPDKGAFIYEDQGSNRSIGMIMYCIRNRDTEYPWKPTFSTLDRSLFQSDGRFMEIFQLWVHPDYRRLGLATQLKLKLEEDALLHKVDLIYTHTEERNDHVIELNQKLGYQEVWRGPVRYEDLNALVNRVCLIKRIKIE